jgi:hypothetical protein
MAKKNDGKIARKLLKVLVLERGVRISLGTPHELNGLAKATGVSAKKIRKFVMPLVHELVDEVFAKKATKKRGHGHGGDFHGGH